MLYAFTKAQLERLAELHPGDTRMALLALAKPSKVSDAQQDLLVGTGLFAYRNNKFVSLVRTVSSLEAARAGAEAAPPVKKPKPLNDPAAVLLEHFCRYYLRYCRCEYHVGGADKAAARRLVTGKGTLWIKDAVKYYVKHRRSFFPKDGKATVGLLEHNINEVLTKVVRPGNGEETEADSW